MSNGYPACNTYTPQLTTTFTPPASCLSYDSTFTLGPEGSDTLVGASAYTRDYFSIIQGLNSACYPPDFYAGRSSTVNGSTTLTVAQYYSPAVCPSAWTDVSITLQGDVSTAICCPM